MLPTIELMTRTNKEASMRDTKYCIQDERTSDESGYSLVELVVGVTIFVIVLGAIYGLLELGRSGRLNTTQRSEVLQNMRIALNTMGRDCINAGVDYPNQGAAAPDNSLRALFNISNIEGESTDDDDDADLLTPVYPKNNVNRINNLDTDQLSLTFIDDTFNGGENLPVDIPEANSSERLVTTGADTTMCSVGDIYVVIGRKGAAIGMLTNKTGDTLFFDQGDPLGINGAANAANPIFNIEPTSVQRVVWANYYVADEDGNGTATGTLRRRVYGGANAGDQGFVDQPLAFGVQNLQIQYVLANGEVVDVPDLDEMQTVRQVRVTVSVRSPDRDPKTNRPFESTLTSTFSTRNLTYEKL